MKYEPHIAYSEGSKPLTLFKKNMSYILIQIELY